MICSLHFSMASRWFGIFNVYFLTAWDADGELEYMYDVLNLLVHACVEAGDIPLVGGDFNACIGSIVSHDLTFLQQVRPISIGQNGMQEAQN